MKKQDLIMYLNLFLIRSSIELKSDALVAKDVEDLARWRRLNKADEDCHKIKEIAN